MAHGVSEALKRHDRKCRLKRIPEMAGLRRCQKYRNGRTGLASPVLMESEPCSKLLSRRAFIMRTGADFV
jgi:hypothetical protein